MADPDSTPQRKALSVRTRFEVFKRDNFTCRYCGRKTPEVVLEVDHVVPVCDGGTNDEMNLVTACWECNSGKAGVQLSEVVTGEDPHDRAILLMEKQRQLREYDYVLAQLLAVREQTAEDLLSWWCEEADVDQIPKNQFRWLVSQLEHVAPTTIREAMSIALGRGMTRDWRYVMVIIRNWRDEGKV